MGCTNCFSGCTETTSDKCVKYTGNDITFLNIHTGDSLEAVENAVTDYLATVFSGVGILPTLDPSFICDTVKHYLPHAEWEDPTLVDILTAIINTICDIEASLVVQTSRIDTIEGIYTPYCIPVNPTTGTHSVLQSVIVSLCTAINDIGTLTSLYATCITQSNIASYIQNYLNQNTTSSNMYTKMVPYVVYPFYPTSEAMSGAFDFSGAGIGIWQKVYLCNGLNHTPDLRGRSLIGTTDTRVGSFNSAVDPGISGNPSYTLGTLQGANSVVLKATEIAAHNHAATVHITDPGHLTTIEFKQTSSPVAEGGSDTPLGSINNVPAGFQQGTLTGKTSPSMDKTGLDDSNVAVTNANNNSGAVGHNNIHPVIGVYYIIYIPTP